MSEMNTRKILELMGLTSAPKMRALERMESFPTTGEESANEMLNKELFGVPAKESVSKKRPIANLPRAKKSAKESFDGIIPAPFGKYYDIVDVEEIVKDYGYDTIAEYLKENAADGETYIHGLYGVEDEPHLGCKHIAWLRAKPEYIDKLGEGSLDVVELAEKGGKKYLSQMVRDNSIRVDEEALSLIKGSAKESVSKKRSVEGMYRYNSDGTITDTVTGQVQGKDGIWRFPSDKNSERTPKNPNVRDYGYNGDLPYAYMANMSNRAGESAEDNIAVDGIIYADVRKKDDDAIVAHFDYFAEDFSDDRLEEIKEAFDKLGYEVKEAEKSDEKSDAAEAVAAEDMTVETSVDAKFPENFNFDEEAFADAYEIDKETIACTYKPEDVEAKIAEHIEVSFTHDNANVVLNIYADGRVDETVDAEEIEPQFTAEFEKRENDEGVEEDYLKLELIEDTGKGDDDKGVVKSEEDVITESEGDENHVDENGSSVTPEFIEEAGLNLDPFYSKKHKMKVADKGAGVAPAAMAKESLAAKVIRTRK